MRYLRAYSVAIFVICLVAACFADSLLRLGNTEFDLLAFVFILGFVSALVPMGILMFAGEFKHRKSRNVPWEYGRGFFAYSRHIRFRAWVVAVLGYLVLWFAFDALNPNVKSEKGALVRDGTHFLLVTKTETVPITQTYFEQLRLARVLIPLQIATTITWVATVYYCVGLKWPLFDDTFQFNDLFESNTRR